MAEVYSTEEEQLEALKKWWRENGKSTVISLVVVLAAVFGWQGWQKQQLADIEAASIIYQNLLLAVSTNSEGLSETQQLTAAHLADTLKADFPGSTYALYAALFKAQFAVNEGKLAVAAEELNWIVANDPDAELFLQANMRLARVYAAQGDYDRALALLAIDAGAYATAYEETRGDIYSSQQQYQQALLAYQKAVQLAQQAEPPVPNPVLALKLKHIANLQTVAEGAADSD